MAPIVATSNVEAVMLGVVGSLAASLLYLLVFRGSTRPKIEVTATAGEDHIEVVIANNSQRAMFDVQVRATAVMFDGAMGTTYKNTRPLTLSETTIPVLLAARRAQDVMMAPGSQTRCRRLPGLTIHRRWRALRRARGLVGDRLGSGLSLGRAACGVEVSAR
jgi:hypothetical protein